MKARGWTATRPGPQLPVVRVLGAGRSRQDAPGQERDDPRGPLLQGNGPGARRERLRTGLRRGHGGHLFGQGLQAPPGEGRLGKAARGPDDLPEEARSASTGSSCTSSRPGARASSPAKFEAFYEKISALPPHAIADRKEATMMYRIQVQETAGLQEDAVRGRGPGHCRQSPAGAVPDRHRPGRG